MLTHADLTAICQRYLDATPGPWEAVRDTLGHWRVKWSHSQNSSVLRGDKAFSDEDIAFIVHARADIPALLNDLQQLHAAIRKIRDTRGDDRCWKDYETLFALLLEGYTSPERDTEVELENCRQYIRACRDPRTAYVSPQREIERLQAIVNGLAERVAAQSELLSKRAEAREPTS